MPAVVSTFLIRSDNVSEQQPGSSPQHLQRSPCPAWHRLGVHRRSRDLHVVASRGLGFLDWHELYVYYSDVTIVTVPIDAPEGVLGALTGVMHAERPEAGLVSELQSLAEHLAHSLTFCKCKSDLQARLACLLYRLGAFLEKLGPHRLFPDVHTHHSIISHASL